MHFIAAVLLASTVSTTLAKIFPVTGNGRYKLSYWQAYQKCHERGAALATKAELVDAVRNGYSYCSCGWLADKHARYPMAVAIPACGGRAAVHHCDWRDRWDAFCFMGDPVGNCSRPLGMENGQIGDLQLTSSSAYHTFWTERWGAHLARLNREGVVNAWMPHHDGRNQYIEVNFEKPMAVTGIITQGVRRYLQHQYVKSYKIAYSKDGDLWLYYTENGSPKVFRGNRDNNGRVRNMLSEVILAQHIRVYPHQWFRHISLRFELLGCDIETYDAAMEKKRERSG